MHEAAFSTAARPAPARVLGLTLKPYSIGHELCLVRETNGLALCHAMDRITKKNVMEDLPMAALICSQSWSEIKAMNRDWFIGLKLRFWRWRIRGMDRLQELIKFFDHQASCAAQFPGDLPYSSKPQRSLGAPELLRLHAFVWLQMGKGEEGAWDFPIGLARMYYASYLELEGHWNIRGEYEEEYEKARDEWLAENPGNTLRRAN